jgi:hypothetical protein
MMSIAAALATSGNTAARPAEETAIVCTQPVSRHGSTPTMSVPIPKRCGNPGEEPPKYFPKVK